MLPKLCTASASSKSCSVPENKVLPSTLFREMPTSSCKCNHNHCFSTLFEVDIAGITGPVQFDGNGRRIVSRLDILNLRNDSFKRVSSIKGVNNPFFFSAQTESETSEFFEKERLSLDWISPRIGIRKGSFKRVGSVEGSKSFRFAQRIYTTEFLLILTLSMCR